MDVASTIEDLSATGSDSTLIEHVLGTVTAIVRGHKISLLPTGGQRTSNHINHIQQ